MRLKSICRLVAIVPALLLFGAGCSGIVASHSISPLSFFLPGLVQTDTGETGANEPIVPVQQLDSEKELAKFH